MRRITPFALAALVPAALNFAAPASALTMPICSGDGQVRAVSIPGGGDAPGAPSKDGSCCAKGCHAGGSRKKPVRGDEGACA